MKLKRLKSKLAIAFYFIVSVFFIGSCKSTNLAASPKWKEGMRFERIGKFEVEGTASKLFPLLCPVEEYKWLPGWSCTMNYSKSGVAEKDAVFETTENLGMKVTWINITYKPDKFIEYLMISGKNVVRLSISLEESKENTTQVSWRMLFTANSILAKKILPKAFSEENFQKMMDNRKNELDYYLKNGRMIGKDRR